MILLVLVATGLGFVAKGQTEYLVTIDPATGAFTKVNSLPGVNWIAGNGTLDNIDNSYIFQGGPSTTADSFYLYKANNTTGIINSKVSFPDNNGVANLLYIDSLKAFYGTQNIAFDSPGPFNLVSVNVNTGIITIIKLFDSLSAADYMTYNHNLNQLIILGIKNGSWDLLTVDANTGNIISDTLCLHYYELHFDNTTNQLFGIYEGSNPFQLGVINTTTGQFFSKYNFPSNVLGFSTGASTFDEKDQEYIVVANTYESSTPKDYLNFLKVATGNVVYQNLVEPPGGDTDNVIYYRYDNTTNILYALHWEAVTLPVTLLSFTASKQGAQNLLQWATTQEVNSSYFGVERSDDGVNFTSIGQVDAAGNSSLAKSYSLVDSKPVNGTDYYRLKMVDKDGKFSYSEIRSVNEAVGFGVSIYPNPVENNLNLNFSSDKAETVEVVVVDNGGKVVAEQEVEVLAGASMQSINVGALSSGSYYVRVVGEEGDVEERFVKE